MGKYGRAAVKGILHTDGRRFVNGDGAEIILEGYGVGNWLNPEGFMIGSPAISPEFMAAMRQGMGLGEGSAPARPARPMLYDRYRSVEAAVRELCGQEYLDTFWKRWFDNHLSEADIRAMAELDLNCVRLVLNAAIFLKEEPGIQWIEENFQRLGRVLDWCEKYGIYAILDMHAAPGGQAGCMFDNGYDSRPRLFYEKESWDRALLLWEELARRFGDRWIIGGYDLLNEPLSLPADGEMLPKLAQFYDEAIAAIRKHDRQHMFTLEGAYFSRDNGIFDHDFDPECHNWCIHWHRYNPSPERKEIYPYLLTGMEWNVPVWIGEGGGSAENNAVFYNIAKDYGIGFCLWCWKTAEGTGEGGNGCVCHKLPRDWGMVQGYFNGGEKPAYEKAIAIFNEYLENMKYENCIQKFDHIRKSRRKAPFELPAVGYDNLPGNGESFAGNWEYGNLLNYRLEDHTKLVWDASKRVPILWVDQMSLEPPHDPLKELLLELAAGEFAVYTVRDIPENCRLYLSGKALEDAEVCVQFDSRELGKLCMSACTDHKGEPVKSEAYVEIPACSGGKIKLLVQKGTVQLSILWFEV